jgi:hypothetical protein
VQSRPKSSGTARLNVDALAPKLWAAIKRLGRSLVKDGQPIRDDAAGVAEVANQIRPFVAETLPVWRRFGI